MSTGVSCRFLQHGLFPTQGSNPQLSHLLHWQEDSFPQVPLGKHSKIWNSPRDRHPGCEVKWTLESITTNKASGGDGIPVELFQILKEDAVKVLHSICQKIWNIQQWPQDWKRSVFIPIQKKGSAKQCSNYLTIAFISHASKVMLKILQARLQQYVNCELPDV